MSDKMKGIGFRDLCRYLFNSLYNSSFNKDSQNKSVFGIDKSIFYTPFHTPFNTLGKQLFSTYIGKELHTPLGLAAGPHTQLSQNIISAYLCGVRFIELKTVQTLDSLEVTKPCIDAEDEGYNCEWSQELNLTESFHEYCNAWIILHFLAYKNGIDIKNPGFIFNMSVGYDFKGIMEENVQMFLFRMENAESFIQEKLNSIKTIFPELAALKIPGRISDNVTLSTMHGCPPDEIEKIAAYLIKERNLHTTIKLNPTLLGPKKLRSILNKKLNYKIEVPDEAFEHDLKLNQAKEIITTLTRSAEQADVHFTIKLTNTLECLNKRDVFQSSEKQAYASGRALHALSVHVAELLQKEFGGTLNISISGGVDCFNISDVLNCSLHPVTVCSDILKPGGYTRLPQYLINVQDYLEESSLNDLLGNNSDTDKKEKLTAYAEKILKNDYYKKDNFISKSIKIKRDLPLFDCAAAPCEFTCPAGQNVALYMFYTKNKQYNKALEIINKTNPFPSVTGLICDHVCQYKCTRQNYDNSVNIRHIKRFISEKGKLGPVPPILNNGKSAAVIGAGPAGLSCAWYLRMTGYKVTVYEAADTAGGMITHAIPDFRIKREDFEKDLNRILKSGVILVPSHEVSKTEFEILLRKHDALFIGAGAQLDKKLGIPGEEEQGVYGALEYLRLIKSGQLQTAGKEICIIGGGNSAMDAARSALRLKGKKGGSNVHLLYRRTVEQMPADKEELIQIINEGVEIHELYSPLLIEAKGGKLILQCRKMKLGKVDKSDRKRALPLKNKVETFFFDTIISAIGQDRNLNFLHDNGTELSELVKKERKLFIGGDVRLGPESIITAIADGLTAAESICDKNLRNDEKNPPLFNEAEQIKQAGIRIFGVKPEQLPLNKRGDFSAVIKGYEEDEAVREASRCLSCSEICNICVTVCPNRALSAVASGKISVPVYGYDSETDEYKVKDTINLQQRFQILHITDFCNECGNCFTFCPSKHSPYKIKASICLSAESLKAEEEVYFVEKNEIRYKSPEGNKLLWIEDRKYHYTDGQLSAQFSLDHFFLISVTGSLNKTDLRFAAEMRVIKHLAGKMDLQEF